MQRKELLLLIAGCEYHLARNGDQRLVGLFGPYWVGGGAILTLYQNLYK